MSKRVVWAKPESMSSDRFSYESGLTAYVPASELAAAEAEIERLKSGSTIDDLEFEKNHEAELEMLRDELKEKNRRIIEVNGFLYDANKERDEALGLLDRIRADLTPTCESNRHPCVLNYECATQLHALLAKHGKGGGG